jgi:hypothetical protein
VLMLVQHQQHWLLEVMAQVLSKLVVSRRSVRSLNKDKITARQSVISVIKLAISRETVQGCQVRKKKGQPCLEKR